MTLRFRTFFLTWLLLIGTSVPAAPGTEPIEPRTPSPENARRQAQRVMNAGLPFAEKMLAEFGEFAPFGAVMRPEGLIQNLASDDGPEETVEQIYEHLAAGLREGAESGKYTVVATFVLVEIPDPADGKPITAVHVALEHLDGYCADVFFPVVRQGRTPALGDAFAGRREGAFFDTCR